MRHKTKLLIALQFILATSLYGQSSDPRTVDERLSRFAMEGVGVKIEGGKRTVSPLDKTDKTKFDQGVQDLADAFLTDTVGFVYYALPPKAQSASFREFLQSGAKSRLDEQIGSPSSAGGSTSVASRTGLTSLIGMAVEAGAVSQTIDQSVLTLRANADGLARFLTNESVFSSDQMLPPCDKGETECAKYNYLKDVEISASFNIGDSGSQTLTGTSVSGDPVEFSSLLKRRQFSSATFRWAAKNDRDLRSAKYRDKWLNWFETNKPALSAAGRELLKFIDAILVKGNTEVAIDPSTGKPRADKATVYAVWREQTIKAMKGGTADIVADIFAARLDVLLDELRKLDPDFDTRLQTLSDAYVRYFALQRDLESTLVDDSAMTAEFTYSEPALQPKLFTAKFAFAFSPSASRSRNPGTVSLNFGVDMFTNPQPTSEAQNTSRWKDVQAALQFDRPIGARDSALRFSLGAYYQYQINPSIIVIPEDATTLPGTTIPLPSQGSPILSKKGQIVVLQMGLTLQKPGGGLKIPMGVSWSNRTELLTGNTIRGHLGFTFDSSPLALLSSFR